jgi:hypothetical protein
VAHRSGELVPLFIPALVAILAHREAKKGTPLTEEEVLEIRDKATCVMVPASTIPAMVATRGYEDVDPENCWAQWQEVRVRLSHTGE